MMCEWLRVKKEYVNIAQLHEELLKYGVTKKRVEEVLARPSSAGTSSFMSRLDMATNVSEVFETLLSETISKEELSQLNIDLAIRRAAAIIPD